MTVSGEGKKPSREHCLNIANGAGIAPRIARRVFDQVNDAVKLWREFAEQAHCPRPATDAVAARLSML